MDIKTLQAELRRCTAQAELPWGRKQNNHWDKLTNFIYRTQTWADLQLNLEKHTPSPRHKEDFAHYATHRWFNYWSARGVEAIFCQLDGVKAATNAKDRLVDFSIRGIRFDHKTSVFPKNFDSGLKAARENPRQLIQWLYKNQSRQQRYHLHNRLFVILYDMKSEDHWRLRAELIWLQSRIKDYVKQFHPENLEIFDFNQKEPTLADVIWAVKY